MGQSFCMRNAWMLMARDRKRSGWKAGGEGMKGKGGQGGSVGKGTVQRQKRQHLQRLATKKQGMPEREGLRAHGQQSQKSTRFISDLCPTQR